MYNRYIPQQLDFQPIDDERQSESSQSKLPFSFKQLLSKEGTVPWRQFFSAQEGDPLDGLLKSLKLEGIDSGDILLVLLILFLLIEGDDQWELIITLGLLLIMGLAQGED